MRASAAEAKKAVRIELLRRRACDAGRVACHEAAAFGTHHQHQLCRPQWCVWMLLLFLVGRAMVVDGRQTV
jgi:hypothetical protein